MQVEAYFQRVRDTIEESRIVVAHVVTYDKRSSHTGYIRGELYFVDGSVLHMREFVDVETEVERLAYAYQYMTRDQNLVFRYDNSGHHRSLNLATYPHHKHERSEDHVIAASPQDLSGVLGEIQALINLPSL